MNHKRWGKKGFFDDFIPPVTGIFFIVIALAMLGFVKSANVEQRQLSFEYHHGLLSANTKLIANVQNPLDKDCPWFHIQGLTEEERIARANLIYEYGRNKGFTNLDWITLFMRLHPKAEVNTSLGDEMFIQNDPYAKYYVEGYFQCVESEKKEITLLDEAVEKRDKIAAELVNAFIGANVLQARDQIFLFGLEIPSQDITQDPWAFEYKRAAKDEV